MTFSPPRLCCACLAILSANPAVAQTRHAEAHVHGTTALTLVVIGHDVSMALDIPAADVVGFERMAASEAEETLIDEAISSLSDPLSLFVFSPDAQCAVGFVEAAFSLADGKQEGGHHDDDNHEHGHDEGHAEFSASYRLECSSLSTSDLVLETRFFELYATTETILVEGLIEGAAFRASLTSAEPSVVLR